MKQKQNLSNLTVEGGPILRGFHLVLVVNTTRCFRVGFVHPLSYLISIPMGWDGWLKELFPLQTEFGGEGEPSGGAWTLSRVCPGTC